MAEHHNRTGGGATGSSQRAPDLSLRRPRGGLLLQAPRFPRSLEILVRL